MVKQVKKAWRASNASPLDITLDRRNPRIRVEDDDNESDIIRKLVEHEDVISLAKKIARGGLLPGERIIVTKENDQLVVLEGNRRICACKLLLSPSLVPLSFRKQFPKLTTAAEIDRIKTVPVDVSPDRRTAEHILTLRHTEPGVRKWKPVAKMRRVKRLLDEGYTVEEIALEYNASATNIRKTIREYRLLRLAEELKGLTALEHKTLDDPDLSTNPYTRFFELDGVKEFMGLEFSPNGLPIIRPPRKAFDERLKRIVRALLVDADSTFDTRSTPSEVLGADFKKFLKKRGAGRTEKPKDPTAAKPKPDNSESEAVPPAPPPTPQTDPRRPDKFFESLVCRISDHNIACVVAEIRKINPEQNPICGTYLLRTLVELSLRYLVSAAGKTVGGKHDPTLTDLVNFALNNRGIFPTSRMGDVIEHAKNQKSFEYLNIVVHQKWLNADSTLLKSAANQLRNFVAHVVQGSA